MARCAASAKPRASATCSRSPARFASSSPQVAASAPTTQSNCCNPMRGTTAAPAPAPKANAATPGPGWPPPAHATTCSCAAIWPIRPSWPTSPPGFPTAARSPYPPWCALPECVGVEEDFQTGKGHFGLDHSQVRLYTALRRHIVLTMTALAICTVTASAMRGKTSTLPPEPTDPDSEPPDDPGLIALTVAEVKRLLNLVTRTWRTASHHLHWNWWRRRHQARARWYHQRTRLRRQAATP
jgi:hypothetical protein